MLATTTAACSAVGTGEASISDSLMVELLTDLHLADARQDVVGDLPASVRDSVLLAHGLTQSDFDRAVAYYADDPEAYLAIYNQVIDKLTAEQPSVPSGDAR